MPQRFMELGSGENHVIPSDIRLYTWLDVDEVLRRALKGDHPPWFIEANAYWDSLTVCIQTGRGVEADQWFRQVFEPRVRDRTEGIAGSLDIVLEGISDTNPRVLQVIFDESDEPTTLASLRPTFARPSVVRPNPGGTMAPAELPTGSPPVFAFHSFKGGAGRTVHALALAHALSDRTQRVLLIDADLEAPGISWLTEGRLSTPPVSFADLLALVHGDPDEQANESIELVTTRVRDALLDNIYVLPAFRSRAMFQSLDIRPEHIVNSRKDPYFLTSVIARIGKSLNVDAIIIDLRAGISELSAGLLLDPRVIRVLVTTLSGQALAGTELVLNLLAERSPSSMDSHPIPTIILNQIPRELQGSDLLSDAETKLLQAVWPVFEGDGKDGELESSEVLKGPSWLDPNLIVLSRSWDSVAAAIRSSQVASIGQALADRVVPSTTLGSPIMPKIPLDEKRRKLYESAKRRIYAERGESDDFLPIVPLRNLVESHRAQLPIAVIIGAKGAGKTFVFLQLVLKKTWQTFAAAVSVSKGVGGVEAQICPVLQPDNVEAAVQKLLEGARAEASKQAGAVVPFDASTLKDKVRDWLMEDLHEGQWRDRWLDLMAWSAGFETGKEGAGRRLPEQLAQNQKRLLFVFDGLEETFLFLSNRTAEQRALRSLLVDVPNWLEQLPSRTFGVLVFVRKDMVSVAVVQNTGQFTSKYEPYALKWDRAEALQLAGWISSKAGVFESSIPHQVHEKDEPAITDNFVHLWGRKLGGDQSKEGRSTDWVLAALSDFRGQIQARDLVRFLSLAAERSEGNVQWLDRVLAPNAIRQAIQDCSLQKVVEIEQENPSLKEIFDKLRALPPTAQNIPFTQEEVGLSSKEIGSLDLNGIIADESGRFYMAEIFRRALGFGLKSGARPRVLAMARKLLNSVQ